MFKPYISRKKYINDQIALDETMKYYPYCHNKKIYRNLKKSVKELTKPPPFCAVKTLGANRCYLKCACEPVKKKKFKIKKCHHQPSIGGHCLRSPSTQPTLNRWCGLGCGRHHLTRRKIAPPAPSATRLRLPTLPVLRIYTCTHI